jgi:hypothetical protein
MKRNLFEPGAMSKSFIGYRQLDFSISKNVLSACIASEGGEGGHREGNAQSIVQVRNEEWELHRVGCKRLICQYRRENRQGLKT